MQVPGTPGIKARTLPPFPPAISDRNPLSRFTPFGATRFRGTGDKPPDFAGSTEALPEFSNYASAVRLAGSTLTPGPMVEESATRLT